jgi:hypothetical protein
MNRSSVLLDHEKQGMEEFATIEIHWEAFDTSLFFREIEIEFVDFEYL